MVVLFNNIYDYLPNDIFLNDWSNKQWNGRLIYCDLETKESQTISKGLYDALSEESDVIDCGIDYLLFIEIVNARSQNAINEILENHKYKPMFSYSCFIEVMNEKFAEGVEETLRAIGYVSSNIGNIYRNNGIATTGFTGKYSFINKEDFYSTDPHRSWKNNRIDCKRNVELFISLAALNDHNDLNQWIKVPGSGIWQRCTQYNSNKYGGVKVTKDEIIERFEKNGKI